MPPKKLNTSGQFVTTQAAQAVNVNLLQPRAFEQAGKPKGEPKYGITLLLDPDGTDVKTARALLGQIAKEAFPDVPIAKIKMPIAMGDKLNEKRVAKAKKAIDFYKGKAVLTARSGNQPRLSAEIDGGVVDLTDPDQIKANGKVFYAGALMLAQVNFAPYGDAVDADGGDSPPGITAYLNHVYSTGRGERIGGGAPAAETFKAYVGTASSFDPTQADDEPAF